MHNNCHQFVTKMHHVAPNCVSNLKKFPGVIPQTLILGRGYPLPRPLPQLGASRLDS